MAGLIARALDRVDGGAHAAPGRLTAADDGSRLARASWELRTFIALFPPEAPLRFLNLNVTVGPTGLPFDRTRPPDHPVDLQLVLEGRGRAVTFKRTFPARTLPEARVSLTGCWPRYAVSWRQPEDALALDLELVARDDVWWWARAPRLYGHYTSFCQGRIRWRWGRDHGVIEAPVLHDHGWGRRLPGGGALVRLFRYEVLSLAQGSVAAALWVRGPAGVTLRRAALVRLPGGPILPMPRFASALADLTPFVAGSGDRRYLPGTWTAHLQGNAGALRYQARRATEPRAVFGDGCLYAFDFTGEGSGALAGPHAGEGYAEQLGAALHRPCLETTP